MSAKTIMILGSMSSVGKSLLVSGLCRIYARKGWKVAPFKAQNMSNNAAVCSGGEIGRAQAAQAYACGIDPTVDMNPILLKPEADSHSQVIIRGKVWDSFTAKDYYSRRETLWQAVTQSYANLNKQYELLIIEGAGSPAELNLKANDIVNLAVAHYANAPCLLAGDIDRGGIFAQLLGTLWLLNDFDRRMIKGLIVNKFRGDLNLFTDGVKTLADYSGIPVLGVVPYIHNHGLAEEDAATICESLPSSPDKADIAVIHFPHISNFDDFDPLAAESEVQVRYVQQSNQLGKPAAILLPGTKNTLADLQWLHKTGLAESIKRLAAAGTPVVGLCGGYQMLGSMVSDENAVESVLKNIPGLGLLPGETRFELAKTVTRSQAQILAARGFAKEIRGQLIHGYEIHMGQTYSENPFCRVFERESEAVDSLDGAYSPDGKIWGTYLHGVFDNDSLRMAWLESLGVSTSTIPFTERRSKTYDLLADALEASLDMKIIDQIIAEGV
jgi:adenosylcobyric acid synthase